MINKGSIKQRLALLITLVSVLAVTLTTLFMTAINLYNLQESLANELQITAKVVGERNQAIISFGTAQEAQNNLQQIFSSKPSVVLACLYKEQGKVFAGYSAKSQDANFGYCPPVSELVPPSPGHVRATHALSSGGLPVGFVMLESDMREVPEYIRNQLFTALFVVLVMWMVAYLMAVVVQKNISEPILSLAATARKVSDQKDYSLRAIHEGGAELSTEMLTLFNAFNEMLSEIQERELQLQRKNEELGKAKEVAESANRSKSHFLANISHELRTPLNAIIGFSSILVNQLFGTIGHPKYMEYAKDINDSGVHLLDIINDILDLSKAEAGRLTLAFEEVNIEKAIQKCITIISERAAVANITISTDIPKPLPAVTVDRLRFIQIILNVLSNAVKFTEKGGAVHIAVTTAARAGKTTDFTITIRDTGIGMAQDHIEKAFQSFGQVDSDLNRKYTGTGLGLPLTKKLVDLHYGSIQIKSELGVGTTVILHFLANPMPIHELFAVTE